MLGNKKLKLLLLNLMNF